jgi:hypothetical protein
MDDNDVFTILPLKNKRLRKMFRGRIVFSMRPCWHFTIDHGQGGHLLSFLHSKITSMPLKKYIIVLP